MRQVLGFFGENTFDSIVTDPPYELTTAKRTNPPPFVEGSPFSRHRVGVNGDAKPVGGFMGKEWDGTGVAFDPETWRAAFRVLKPGGHLLAFGGTRTYHRMVCAIEDGGFEIRDQIGWVYGSGFPKSRDVSAMDMTGQDAEKWAGWGTALKPAWEPIVVARKPLARGLTVAANLIEHGVGGLNIDACRVEHVTVDGGNLALNPHLRESINGGNGGRIIAHEAERRVVTPDPNGRWPANLIHDGSDEVLDAFPQAAQQLAATSTDASSRETQNVYGAMKRGSERRTELRREDDKSAARFFYCAKASKTDRNEGLSEFDARAETAHRRTNLDTADNPYLRAKTERLNIHPTVKPTDLMRYLLRLVTPVGGIVLDPFAGSGSTGKAAALEGIRAVLIEREAEYVKIARARIAKALDPN
jgi:site-specific DNA-methyltransferase (adenine-specific)